MKCEICGKKDVKNISIHLSKGHKDVDRKKYYDTYLKKDGEGICFFCGGKAHFYNANRGYGKKCMSDECNKRSWASNTIESIVFKYDVGVKEAEEMLKERVDNFSKVLKAQIRRKKKEDPLYTKKINPSCKEYWIIQGYSEKDAQDIVNKKMYKMYQKSVKNRKEHPELYIGTSTTQVEYWIKKGYSEKEAKLKVSERQRTFTLEKCIEKHGLEDGTKRWFKRQEKWQNTLKSKSSEEIERINKLRVAALGIDNNSKIANELFDKLSSKMTVKECKKVYYSSKNKEYHKYDEKYKRHYLYDFVDSKRKKVIEFNGDFWHCNPMQYNEDYRHPVKDLKANEIWEYDKRKREYMEFMGYDVLIVWELEYRKNSQQIVEKCLDFLRN